MSNNWNNEYGGEELEGVRDRVMGKTYTRLKAVVIGDSFITRSGAIECKPPSNSNDLFIEMGKISGEAGSRMRAKALWVCLKLAYTQILQATSPKRDLCQFLKKYNKERTHLNQESSL